MENKKSIRIITTFRVPDEIVAHLFKNTKFNWDDKVYALPENFSKTLREEEVYQIYINHDSDKYLEYSNDSLCRVVEDSTENEIVVIVILELEGLRAFSKFLSNDFPWKINRYHQITPESLILRDAVCYLYEESIGLSDDEAQTIWTISSSCRKVIDVNFAKRGKLVFSREK